ncbi:hypothetical protein GUITHDRAFT_114173 [Guillardia theta CCMP2712]|uniref:Phosphatidylinositol N-acetylglucosaminyltransferase subunit H conserved domain-containing protein n=1 Tax=Guillardia theta (strain CCMP2712) TaxID=905079 RepID=L1IU79_GUITC|nr:hypothetical protein GUITHDRAFT_114173 [Guillardia theta CCMP2712]EKX39677.1 hypothetical protein GUITHDRAFT_114173 [Guillardia theta CCMP2712]|eukprot:XP_005826657.1 hypothetical protein GUITHDRAFT_114173 [Guillardia theta CCMP2712]
MKEIPSLTVEHHAEGIVEFHSVSPKQPITFLSFSITTLKIGFASLAVKYILDCSVGLFLLQWLSLVLFILYRRRQMMERESLLVVHDLGIQVRRRYYSGKEEFFFVERSRIEDVIINEGIGYATVTYYLAIITKSEKEMLLGFSTLIPCLDDLLTDSNSKSNRAGMLKQGTEKEQQKFIHL